MKRTLLISFLTLIYINCTAQESLNFGVSSGITNYFGDLGNDEFFQASSTRPGMAVTVRNLFPPSKIKGYANSPFNVEARMSWHRIGYDETEPIGERSGIELRNYQRGLSFRTDVIGLSSHVTYTYYPNKRIPLHRQNAAMFVYAGVGVYYGRPKADLFNGDIDISNRYHFWSDGTVHNAPESSGAGDIVEKDGEYETDLIKWNNEAQGYSDENYRASMYSPWHIGFPVGFGFRYGLSKKLTFSVEFSYIKFLNDYLDDVSDAYPTYAEINQMYPNDPAKQELAKYIADPTGLGNAGVEGSATSRRGNPAITDSYSYISLEISYNIRWHPERLKTALLGLF